MADTLKDLSTIPFKRQTGVTFQLSATPAYRFKSPIQQIVSSEVGEAFGRRASGKNNNGFLCLSCE